MFQSKQHSLFTVLINLEAIECSLPAPLDKDKNPKGQYLSVVIKRGEQQREETDPKLGYLPLDQEN